MRKVFIPVAALVLCAAPARAQQALTDAQQAAPAAPSQAAEPARAPALYPTTDQVKADVKANEHRLHRDASSIGSKDWWYVVAAVAVGVIIAAVLLG
jgi:hypothetical protein